jgi:hypothetical protein
MLGVRCCRARDASQRVTQVADPLTLEDDLCLGLLRTVEELLRQLRADLGG